MTTRHLTTALLVVGLVLLASLGGVGLVFMHWFFSPTGKCVATRTRFLMANKALRQMTGRSMRNLRAHTFSEMQHPVMGRPLETRAVAEKIMDGQPVRPYMNCYAHGETGEPVWIQWEAQALGPFIFADAIDITASIRAAAREYEAIHA